MFVERVQPQTVNEEPDILNRPHIDAHIAIQVIGEDYKLILHHTVTRVVLVLVQRGRADCAIFRVLGTGAALHAAVAEVGADLLTGLNEAGVKITVPCEEVSADSYIADRHICSYVLGRNIGRTDSSNCSIAGLTDCTVRSIRTGSAKGGTHIIIVEGRARSQHNLVPTGTQSHTLNRRSRDRHGLQQIIHITRHIKLIVLN